MKHQRDNQGFTLLETLVVMAVLIITVVVLAEIYLGQSLFFQREQARVEVALATTRALTDLARQAREGFAVVASSTFDSVAYASGSQELILKLPALDAQGQIIAGDFDYVVYYRDQQNPAKLMKKTAVAPASSRPAAFKSLNDYVSGLNFSYDNVDFSQVKTIEVFLSSARTVGGMNFQASSTVRALLRNK